MTPQEIYQLVAKGLAETDAELARHSCSNVELIDYVVRYIKNTGGKRLRPTLLLLCSQMCGYEGPVSYRLGAIFELIHTATLVHDDIIDGASVRRGRPSVNARWGNEITVLMGDWLYMTAFNVALAERKFAILDILSDVTRKMIEGELMQLSLNGNVEVTEEQHLEISMRKTAFLFSACAQVGGILGGATEPQQESLRRYGLNVGIAFQLVDDVLDFTSNESVLGKPVGSDLKEGKLTLPLIYLINNGDPAHKELVRTVLKNNGDAQTQRELLMSLVRQYGTADRVLAKAHEYARSAKECLSGFPSGPAREALLSIPDYIVERDR